MDLRGQLEIGPLGYESKQGSVACVNCQLFPAIADIHGRHCGGRSVTTGTDC